MNCEKLHRALRLTLRWAPGYNWERDPRKLKQIIKEALKEPK